MPGPYDYIPPGKKAVMVDGKWTLADLDAKVNEDAVELLAEERLKVAKLERMVKEQAEEIERLNIKALESHKEPKKK